VRSVQNDRIDMGPMHIIRIPDGSCGLAMNNGNVEILLPGVHARNSTMFNFQEVKKLDSPLIELGPIHMFIVRSGTAQVCYEAGKVHIFPEGRYAVNSNTFYVAEIINTQQQNFKFSKHLVLLEGGVSMYVEGLLTFQVANVEKLVYQLGATQLMKAIEAITEAEMVRVFAALHLEQISSPGGDAETPHGDGADAKNIRIRICEKIVHYITPIVAAWGVNINAFQLESTTLANPQYAADYEAASLQMAKAKANLRAQESQNRIMLQSAQASADSVRIAAEGAKKKAIVAAEADGEGVKIRAQAQVAAARSNAESMRIAAEAAARQRIVEAESRNSAAVTMANQYARNLALSNQSVAFAEGLKAEVLTVSDGSMQSALVSSQFVNRRPGDGASKP